MKQKNKKKVFGVMVSKGAMPSVSKYNTLICGYCKMERIDEAMQLFDKMSHKGFVPGIVNYNTFIKGFCQVWTICDE